ncbi:MAG: ABC transporter permease subunit [Myxococcaceae bacterium]
MLVIVLLFGGGVVEAVTQSLTGEAWREVTSSPEFLPSFFLTWRLALVTTLTATLAGTALALALRHHAARGGKVAGALVQIPLAVPHLVVAIGALLLLSQSGLVARLIGAVGLDATLPALVNDEWGVGITLAYVWKEAPFVAVLVLSSLRGETRQLEQLARNLGATRWRVFRDVTLPALVPAASFAALLAFSFTLGSFEVPRLLGRTWPAMLGVWSWQLYTDVDLSRRPHSMVVSLVIVASVLVPALAGLLWRAWRKRNA